MNLGTIAKCKRSYARGSDTLLVDFLRNLRPETAMSLQKLLPSDPSGSRRHASDPKTVNFLWLGLGAVFNVAARVLKQSHSGHIFLLPSDAFGDV